MAQFDPQLYSEFRISYPAALFEAIRPLWSALRRSNDQLRVLDIGAGTGISARSFLESFPDADLRLVEPDEGMRAHIPHTLQKYEGQFEVEAVKGESFSLHPLVHAILIGSAWHWMDRDVTTARMLEVLVPGGFIFIFEYQFPKAMGEGAFDVNEWVRRKFNTTWKPATQTPRGSLEELTQIIRDHDLLNEYRRREWKHEVMISFEEFVGIIRSQSRYLAYERLQGANNDQSWENELKNLWKTEGPKTFTYSFESYLFIKRR